MGESRPQACGQSRPSVQWVPSSSGQPPGESTTTPARSALLGSEPSPTNPGASCSSSASRSPARSSAGRRWGPAAARLQPAATPGRSRPGTRRAPPKRTPPGGPWTACYGLRPSTCSPQPVPPGRAAARTVSLEVGNPSGNAAMVTAAAAAATTRHEAPTWRWRRRREGWLSTGPPSHSSTSWTLPIHSDCSKPLPYGDMATLLQRSARVLHRQELGHASSQPCRAHPGRKTS